MRHSLVRHPRRGLPLRSVLLLVLLLCAAASALAQQPVRYSISFPNAVHHEAEISVTFAELPQQPLEVRMSRTSPGRYALHEFAKNVYSVRAYNGQGEPLAVTRPDPHQWDVAGHDGTVRITYTLFGDRADGTYTGIDNTHAHLNMPATFMWARGLEERPIVITFNRPDPGWKIATQLVPTEEASTFTAPHLQYFLDSPTEISDFELRTWEVESGGRRYTIRLAVHHDGTPQEVDAYAEMARQVVEEQKAVFGELPAFDYGSYTFIACYLPHVAGDGMEHRNSTILTSTRPLSTGALQNLGTLSHEFFHAWNVERIRPRSLEPFDFEEANISGELWFAEGFTSYYTPLIPLRAGIYTLEQYLSGVAGGLNTVIHSPGRRFFSPVEMSMQAPFVDAAVSVDPVNRANTFISYYTWGAALGLGLDLTLRERFRGVTLDDYMRAVWQAHGRDEVPYTLADLERILGQVTRDPAFAGDFFRRYIHGREVPDYERLLGQVGLLLRPARAGEAFLGEPALRFEEGGAVLLGYTLIGTPLREAGLTAGDRILTLGGQPLASAEALATWLGTRRPGETVTIEFEQRGERRSASLTLAENPLLEIVPYEQAGRPLTRQMRSYRDAWLSSRTTRAPARPARR